MAYSTCPHCKHRYFELSENSPTGSRVKLQFIQCSSCGSPIGVLEYYDSGTLLKKQEKAIEALEKRLKHMESDISHIAHKLR